MKKIIFMILFIFLMNFLFADIKSDLIAKYDFKNNANDTSGNGYDGTVYSSVLVEDRDSNENSAYFFNSQDSYPSYINCGDIEDISNAITVTAWVRNDGNSGYSGHIVNRGGFDGDNGYSLFWEKDKLRVELGNESTGKHTDFSIGDPSYNTWNHIAFTWDDVSDKIIIYLNGVEQASGTFVGPLGIPTQNLNIGRNERRITSTWGWSNWYYFHGCVDDVRIYSRALTAAEIEEIYNYVEPDLLVYYDFEEEYSGKVKDQSGNNNHGIKKGDFTYETGDLLGRAGKFDGSGDYLCIENLVYKDAGIIDETTVTAWVKSESLQSQIIISYDRSNYWRLALKDSSGLGTVGWDTCSISGVNDLGTSENYNDGNWHFVAGWFKKDQSTGLASSKIYIDGEFVVSDNNIGTMALGNGVTRYGCVGVGSEANIEDGTTGPNDWFNGLIDEVKIFTSALSENQLKDLYKEGVDLILHYKFNNNTLDETIFENNGTNNGAIFTTDRFIEEKTAMEFDGSTSYINGGNDTSLNITDAITVSAWVKNNGTINGHIVNKGGGWAENGYSLYMNNGDIRVEIQNSSEKAMLDVPVPHDDEWHHIAFTWDINTGLVTVFIDGIAEASTATFTGPIGITSQNLNIGRNEAKGYYFNGLIDDVKIYRRALKTQEITTNKDVIGTFELSSNIFSLGDQLRISGNAFDQDSIGTPLEIRIKIGINEYIELTTDINGDFEYFEDINNPNYVLAETYEVLVEAKDIQIPKWNNLFVTGSNVFQVSDNRLFAYKSDLKNNQVYESIWTNTGNPVDSMLYFDWETDALAISYEYGIKKEEKATVTINDIDFISISNSYIDVNISEGDGVYTFFKRTIYSGGKSAVSKFEIYIDDTAPVVSLVDLLDLRSTILTDADWTNGELDNQTLKYKFDDSSITDVSSGISHYEYGFGTVAGAVDTGNWVSIGLITSGIFNIVGLQEYDINTSSPTYYQKIRVLDNAGNGSIVSSDGIKIDFTPPDLSGVVVEDRSLPLVISWTNGGDLNDTLRYSFNSAIDNLSGIDYYEYSLGTIQGSNDKFGWKNIGGSALTNTSQSGLSLEEYTLANTVYYQNIRAMDNAGNISLSKSSAEIKFDKTPPVFGTVNDLTDLLTGKSDAGVDFEKIGFVENPLDLGVEKLKPFLLKVLNDWYKGTIDEYVLVIDENDSVEGNAKLDLKLVLNPIEIGSGLDYIEINGTHFIYDFYNFGLEKYITWTDMTFNPILTFNLYDIAGNKSSTLLLDSVVKYESEISAKIIDAVIEVYDKKLKIRYIENPAGSNRYEEYKLSE